MSTALPPIDPTFEPASVRNGSPAVQKAYASALDFESMLVQQLSQSLTESGGLGGGGEGEGGSEGAGGEAGGDPVTSQLSSLLPQALTSSVMGHGGLGLAQQLMGDLLPAGSTTAAGSGTPVAGGGTTVPGTVTAVPGGNAVTVGGGSLANASSGAGSGSIQVDPSGGVQA